jgi:hypothetical protein
MFLPGGTLGGPHQAPPTRNASATATATCIVDLDMMMIVGGWYVTAMRCDE